MNALFLKDLAMKTHSDLRGRVEKGKAGGGLCYGYKVMKKVDANGEPIRGDREVVTEEADTIRRIFREFASGKTRRPLPSIWAGRAFPGRLAAHGVIPAFAAMSRVAIINNELYAGVLVWNRLRFIKDPSPGKRVSRINPEASGSGPRFRICVSWTTNFGAPPAHGRNRYRNLWHQSRQHAGRPNEACASGEPPVHLLSGLLTCGCCAAR